MSKESAAALGTEFAPRSYGVALLLALVVILAWGSSFAVTRAAVREIPPLTLAFYRFLLATALVWPLVRRRCPSVRVLPEDRWGVFLLGFVGVTLYFAFENVGLKYTSASHGALIIATIPLCTELAHAWRRRRLPSLGVLTGLIVALFGVGLFFGQGGGGATLRGDLLMFGAVATWVWYTFLADGLVRRYPNLFLTYRIMAVGAATFLPLALFEAVTLSPEAPSVGAWLGVGFLGIFCSVIAYHLWNQVIPSLGVCATNNLLYGIPLVGVLTGVLALGEPFSARIAAGAALVLGGVLVAEAGSRRQAG